MTKSVGLLVMVRIPDQSIPVGHRVMACLQRRGTFNHEKMAPENYPGCLQVTCHGKLNAEEDFDFGLLRELEEELGAKFVETYSRGYHGQILTEIRTADKEVVTFGTLVPIDFIRDLVRLGPDSGGLVYVTEQQINDQTLVFELGKGEPGSVQDRVKTMGPQDSRTIAMFPDEIEAVKKGFEIFGKM
jgi:hypothetical protein